MTAPVRSTEADALRVGPAARLFHTETDAIQAGKLLSSPPVACTPTASRSAAAPGSLLGIVGIADELKAPFKRDIDLNCGVREGACALDSRLSKAPPCAKKPDPESDAPFAHHCLMLVLPEHSCQPSFPRGS